MTVAPSRLSAFAQRRERASRPVAEQCELCAEPIPDEHRHLLDLESRRLLCACRACTILFDRSGAGGGHYRLIPDRVVALEDVDQTWAIPVEMAFFFHSSAAGRIVAFYPSPLGATESLLDLDAWEDHTLAELEPDVEALLVDRSNGRRTNWLLPVDRCYELVGLVRRHWSGFRGGDEVWTELESFFERMRERAERVTRDGKEETWGSRSASRT